MWDTQMNVTPVKTLTPATGETETADIGRVGLYGDLNIAVRGTINTVGGSVDPRGIAALIKRVQLYSNLTQALFSSTGPAINYLLRRHLGNTYDPWPQNNGINAIAAATPVNLDFHIPILVNDRDSVGGLVGGNQESLFTLLVEREADATLGVTAWTDQPTFEATLQWFTIPADPAKRVPTNILHQILTDEIAISSAGEFIYKVPRGATYLGLGFGLGYGEIDTPSGADNFNTVSIRLNQSLYTHPNLTPAQLDIMEGRWRGLERLPGTIYFDMTASGGLGDYDQLRDVLNSQDYTEIEVVFDVVSAPAKLLVLRRQLVPIRPVGG